MVSSLNILTTLAVNRQIIPVNLNTTLANHSKTILANHNRTTLVINNLITQVVHQIVILVDHSQIPLAIHSQTIPAVLSITIQVILIQIVQAVKISTLVLNRLTTLAIHKVPDLDHSLLTIQAVHTTRHTLIQPTPVKDRRTVLMVSPFTPTFLVISQLYTPTVNISGLANVPIKAACPPIRVSRYPYPMVVHIILIVNITLEVNTTQTSVPIPILVTSQFNGRTMLSLFILAANIILVSKVLTNRTLSTRLILLGRSTSSFTREVSSRLWRSCVQYPASMELVSEETCVPVIRDTCPLLETRQGKDIFMFYGSFNS